MEAENINVLGLQETHLAGAAYFLHNEFFAILFGGSLNEREHAGVGFSVSPRVRCAVLGFAQHSPRLASLRVRVEGGQ
eukprot:5497556-Pyramimonas_sp.AAC.1